MEIYKNTIAVAEDLAHVAGSELEFEVPHELPARKWSQLLDIGLVERASCRHRTYRFFPGLHDYFAARRVASQLYSQSPEDQQRGAMALRSCDTPSRDHFFAVVVGEMVWWLQQKGFEILQQVKNLDDWDLEEISYCLNEMRWIPPGLPKTSNPLWKTLWTLFLTRLLDRLEACWDETMSSPTPPREDALAKLHFFVSKNTNDLSLSVLVLASLGSAQPVLMARLWKGLQPSNRLNFDAQELYVESLAV